MSTLKVTVEPLTLHPHLGADRLELTQVAATRVTQDAHDAPRGTRVALG